MLKLSSGLVEIYKEDERLYMGIPARLLGREMLVVNRIARGATGAKAGMMGFGGDEINENTISFSKGPKNLLFISRVSYLESASDTSANGMYRSFRNSNMQPLVAALGIKKEFKDSLYVVDITDLLNGDNDILFFNQALKTGLGLAGMLPDRSYVEDVKAFPSNLDIHTIKSYLKGTETVTYELSSSMVLLPELLMQPRYFDPRIGYFAAEYVDFDANPEGVEGTAMATRWRLEPKDREAYLRGELTEPVKPIVFYIDPATPKKWVPYIMQGVDDWNVAFEQAGFKYAIMAKEAPTDDSTWDINDAAHNVIVYKASQVANASGPHVHDPRSGEIIETHINWYHNMLELLRHWYMIQAGAIDPRARKPELDDYLMGQLIRYVICHEVGHTLGLRHNFGASSTMPVDSLRSRTWLDKNGYTPSIMDYARFNYVAQPEDSIPERDLLPRIGAYDKWAIEWGYRWFPGTESRDAERIRLNQWVISKTAHHPELWFGTETDKDDPRDQSEDIGDNAMKAGEYGIKNLRRILPHLEEWTREPAKDYANLQALYTELMLQYTRYLFHAAKNIGGIETTPKSVEEKGPVVSFVPKARQEEAMRFLQAQLFATPSWLLDNRIFSLTGTPAQVTLSGIQDKMLAQLLSDATLNKLVLFADDDPGLAYTPATMLGELTRGIWCELYTGKPIDSYRRNLQKIYVERVANLLGAEGPQPAPLINIPGMTPAPRGMNKTTDAISVLKGQAQSLLRDIRAGLARQTDEPTKLHLQDCADRLNHTLYPNK